MKGPFSAAGVSKDSLCLVDPSISMSGSNLRRDRTHCRHRRDARLKKYDNRKKSCKRRQLRALGVGTA
jgi:hypothetical protein